MRPWYRSRLFWLALFPLLFVLWAWWDSTSHRTTLEILDSGPGKRFWEVTSHLSELSIEIGGASPAIFLPDDHSFEREEASGASWTTLFPSSFEIYRFGQDDGGRRRIGIDIGYFTVATAYPLFLLSVMLWRYRKRANPKSEQAEDGDP
ncbi:hypothetical protein HNR46_004231 [Haloferula luteola]|uniref:Uncharacterized protein n=1 Tax=Haloferula luteola TaxID=595692 RepID=A0A840VJB8_9BACT|nr:hypothetical protein [Haloferula luteola]MBB5353960.1 hypothetical protein [Haloferula luteola]